MTVPRLSKEIRALPSVQRAIKTAVEHDEIGYRLRRERKAAQGVLMRKGFTPDGARQALSLAMSEAVLASLKGK